MIPFIEKSIANLNSYDIHQNSGYMLEAWERLLWFLYYSIA